MKPKMGIFGDSFAFMAPHWNNSWPGLLENEYEVSHCAMYGTSVWLAFKHFLKNYSKFTHVVFCYTIHNRTHYLPKNVEHYCFLRGQVLEHLKKNMDQEQLEILDAVSRAGMYTNDDSLDKFIYQQVFNEVNRICKVNDIKLVNVMPYEKTNQDDPIINLDSAIGSCIMGVSWVSQNEIGWSGFTAADTRMCHLSPENNMALYKIVSAELNKNEINFIDVKKGYGFQL